MTIVAYAGIDVAFAKDKKLPVCVCRAGGNRLEPIALAAAQFPLPPIGQGNAATIDHKRVQAFARRTLEYLQRVEQLAHVEISVVAIDASRSYTVGRRRACERAMDSMGIHCFATPSKQKFDEIRVKVKHHLKQGGALNRLPHSHQLWMLVGFALFEVLSKHYQCLEVFPQAIATVLGVAGIHKSKAEGVQRQLSALASSTGWQEGELNLQLSESVYGPRHDRLDAYMCAWVASLYPDGVRACGDPPDDVIWVPDVEKLPVLTQQRSKLVATMN